MLSNLSICLLATILSCINAQRSDTSHASLGSIYNPAALGDYGAADWPPSVVGQPLVPQSADEELASMINEIDPVNIQYIIANLTNFGTRHTASSQTDPVRGIGAARDWIAARMTEFAAPSQGRMTVDTPSYIESAGNVSRLLLPTKITNVVARINGTGDPNRVYVMTGHYDSRALDIYDNTTDAPGSDDNASGVAGKASFSTADVPL